MQRPDSSQRAPVPRKSDAVMPGIAIPAPTVEQVSLQCAYIAFNAASSRYSNSSAPCTEHSCGSKGLRTYDRPEAKEANMKIGGQIIGF